MRNPFYTNLCLHSSCDQPPTSFYLVRLISKTPCMVLRLGFPIGTPAHVRNKVLRLKHTGVQCLCSRSAFVKINVQVSQRCRFHPVGYVVDCDGEHFSRGQPLFSMFASADKPWEEMQLESLGKVSKHLELRSFRQTTVSKSEAWHSATNILSYKSMKIMELLLS